MDNDIALLIGQPKQGEDYTQSSNSLFHFMEKLEYLEDAITKKALLPRYCRENIEHLNLALNGAPFKEMAVLMKCFCDIPLHKINQECDCSVQSEDGSNEEKRHCHTSIYGEYALAFSKSWGEQNGIQPISYLVPNSKAINRISDAINHVLSSEEDISDLITDGLMNQLAYQKTIRGKMSRTAKNGAKQIILKNFHDEHEWRFIPEKSFVDDNDNRFETIIANPYILDDVSDISTSPISLLSNKLQNPEYSQYWLKFEYDEVKYIIVPDKSARLGIINKINNLDINTMDKYVLISKLIVLNEVRKDW